MLVLIREFDDRCGWMKWGLRNCAEWLALRCQLSLSAALEKVRTARALQELPLISAAFASGRLSYSKVRALTRVADRHNEERLVEYALEVTAAQVEERCREMRNGELESISTAQRAWARRSLTLRRNAARGTMQISVEVPLADGELIAQALERAGRAGETASGYEFGTSGTPPSVRDAAGGQTAIGNGWLAQQADALVAVARAYLSGEGVHQSTTGEHYQVVVHVDESALRGGAGRSDLPIETVKRLCCDGSVVSVTEDGHGNPLDVGRKRRTVSRPLRRALWARDRGCVFPGCRNKRYVDGHHLRHWADGGGTSLDNTALLCSHHHWLVHEGGFKIRKDADGRLEFLRPDHRVVPRGGYRDGDPVCDLAADEAQRQPSAEGGEVREARGPYGTAACAA